MRKGPEPLELDGLKWKRFADCPRGQIFQRKIFSGKLIFLLHERTELVFFK